eukprot:4325112-Pyramimonas_sp.AAC.1
MAGGPRRDGARPLSGVRGRGVPGPGCRACGACGCQLDRKVFESGEPCALVFRRKRTYLDAPQVVQRDLLTNR